MGMSPISGIQTPQQPMVNDAEDPQVQKNNLFSSQPDGILPTEYEQKVGEKGNFPDPPPAGNVNPKAISGLCSSLSPGAWIALLCVKEAAQEIEQGTKEILTHNDTIQAKLKEEADNIVKGAVAQLVCTVVTSAASIALSSVAGAKSMKLGGLKEGDFAAAKAVPDILNSIGHGTEQIGGSVGSFVNSMYQAENKEVEASIEHSRSIIETVRNHMQAQRDLASKSLDFYNSMQDNINKTRAKIMG